MLNLREGRTRPSPAGTRAGARSTTIQAGGDLHRRKHPIQIPDPDPDLAPKKEPQIKTQRHHLKAALALVLLFQLAILIILNPLPNPLDALRLQLTFSAQEYSAITAAWTEAQRQAYLHHYYLDFIYPLIYAGALILLLKKFRSPVPQTILALPVLMAVADEIENICGLYLILNPDNLSQAVVVIGASAASLKWGLLLLILILLGRRYPVTPV